MRFLLSALLISLSPINPLLPTASASNRAVSAQNEYTDKIGNELIAAVKEAQPDEIALLVSRPEFAKKLIRWKFQNTVSAETLADLQKNRDRLIRSSFLNDDEWMMGFLNSGPIPHPDKALRNLSVLYKQDSKIASNPVYKKLATAAALEFARNINPEKPDAKTEWTEEKMIERYGYFRTSHDQDLLNAQFDKLDFWDMRILAGSKTGRWGTKESLTWQRDNVRLPAQSYTGACWQAPYRLHNQWGESIHGRDYYVPFQNLFASQAEMTKIIGAVCGGLSTYGAQAAVANGIPALTMGEPGHCAYTVRTTTDHWVPAYSLSWKRGCHWNFYGQQWSHLILLQKTFSDKEKRDQASLFFWLGEAADKAEEKEMARSFYLKALMTQPKNYVHWTAYINRELKDDSLSKEQWSHICKQICAAYAKDYPEICWQILSNKIYPKLFPLLSTDEEKLAELNNFHSRLDKMSPAQWDYHAALDKQRDLLSGNLATLNTFSDLLVKAHLTSDAYGAPTLTWCNEKMSIDKELHKQFLDMVAKNADGAEGHNEAITALATSIMMQAENSENIDSFQAAGQMLKDKFKPRLPKFEPFPGELLSTGGVLKLSSVSNRWGEKWQHWGVLEECGGHFHTDNKDDPTTATVLLKRVGTISGIVLIHSNSHYSRNNNTVVEVSIDGQAWTEVGKIEKMQRVNRIGLQNRNIQAKYVRLSRAGKEFMHFQAILVYGTRAS